MISARTAVFVVWASVLIVFAVWPGAGLAQTSGTAQDTANVQALEAAARTGDASAQLALAEAYNAGLGTFADYLKAEQWYAEASAQGVARATLMLGRYARSGLTGPADGDRAVALFETAAAQGAVEAHLELGLLYESGVLTQQDGEAARRNYMEAAQNGSTEAEASLGTLLYEGKLVQKDLDAARTLFLKAARAGNARAQNNLGLMFVRGEGVEQDYEAAALWFELAAEQGERSAMTNLGTLYDNGFGVPQSDEEAKRWYRMAADTARGDHVAALGGETFDPWLTGAILGPSEMSFAQGRARLGDPVAHYRLALTAMAADPANYLAAADHLQRAADAGYAPAMINLGLLYQRGDGVIEDFSQAYALFSRASLAGLPAAADLRDSLASGMTAVQILEAQKLAASQ